MIERIAVVVVVAAVVTATVWLGKWLALRSSRQATALHGWGDADLGENDVTVVLFTGPQCTQCAAQRTAIGQARAQRSGVGYAEFDASIETELARRLTVLSVPTTVVVDRAGNVVSRNGRLVDGTTLGRQIDKALALHA